MKKVQSVVPTIIEDLNPVTEQFGPVTHNSDQMQLPKNVEAIPRFVLHTLTASEQAICDAATD